MVWPGHFSLVQTDEALAQVAASIRRYHDAAADFRFDGFAWSDRGADPRGPSEVLCHNDLAPWNLVRSERGQWTFIDWDLAAPGRLAWDLAWALLSFTPLLPHSTLTDAQTRHRLTVFYNAYGTPLPNDLIGVAIERCAHEAEQIEQRGKAGVEPYARLLAEGHAAIWRSARLTLPRSTCSGNPLCPDPFRAAVAREHSPDEIVCTADVSCLPGCR